jgi:hypothetical protein
MDENPYKAPRGDTYKAPSVEETVKQYDARLRRIRRVVLWAVVILLVAWAVVLGLMWFGLAVFGKQPAYPPS